MQFTKLAFAKVSQAQISKPSPVHWRTNTTDIGIDCRQNTADCSKWSLTSGLN